MRRVGIATFGALLAALCISAATASPVYYLHADIVRGGEGVPQGPVCVPNSVFMPGESIVWRAKIFDSFTGEELTAGQIEMLGITLTAEMSDGTSVDLHYVGHPPGANLDYYFTTHYVIPDDQPVGTLDWTLTATDAQGNTATFEPVGQKAGLGVLTIASPN